MKRVQFVKAQCLEIDQTAYSFNLTGPVAFVAKFWLSLVLTWMGAVSRGLGDLFHSESCKKDLEQHFIDAIMRHPQETVNMFKAKQVLLEVLEELRSSKYPFDRQLLEPLSRQVQRQSKGHDFKAQTLGLDITDEEIKALVDRLGIANDPDIMANLLVILAARSGGA